MPTNLTGSTIASTFDQLLHVDDGPTATEKTVYSGTGVATALKVGTTSASVGNVQLTGNTVQATTGNLTLGSAIAFGSASNARTALGLGTMATQNSGAVAITGGTLSGVTITGSFTGLTLVESVTLATGNAAAGCNLNGSTLAADGTDANIDLNITPKGTGRTVVGALSATSPRVVTGINDTNGNELLKVTATASAVNELTLANAATGNGPTLSATGDDTNININITPKGTGQTLSSGKMGYPTGTGGTVTQATSRTTGVTLNKITGEIVLFAVGIAGHEADEFVLTNSTIEANDVIMVCIKNGGSLAAGTRKYYVTSVHTVGAGTCTISVGNLDNGAIPSESPVIQFLVLKGAVA
jgi:hypothetical protein